MGFRKNPDYERPYPDDGRFRVIPDYSVRLNLEGLEDRPEWADGVLISPRYDSVVIYPTIGSAILRCIMDEGMAHLLMDEATGRYVADMTGIPLMEETRFITEPDHTMFLNHQTKTLDDRWLDD